MYGQARRRRPAGNGTLPTLLGSEVVMGTEPAPTRSGYHEIDQWARELEAGAQLLPAEGVAELQRALVEIEEQSKEAVRREWGLPNP